MHSAPPGREQILTDSKFGGARGTGLTTMWPLMFSHLQTKLLYTKFLTEVKTVLNSSDSAVGYAVSAFTVMERR